MYLRTCERFKSANHKKVWVGKLKIRKVPQLQNAHKSNKYLESANLRICDFVNLFVDRPPLLFSLSCRPLLPLPRCNKCCEQKTLIVGYFSI